MAASSFGSFNPPRPPLTLDLWQVLRVVESVALAIIVAFALASEIGLRAALALSAAVLTFGAEVLLSAIARPVDDRLPRWMLTGIFVFATLSFILSIRHQPRAIAVNPESVTQPPLPPVVAPPPATAIDISWDKSAPKSGTFVISDGRDCGPEGDGEDTLTNIRKNRIDVPADYHEVKWVDIAHVPFPRDKVVPKALVRWSADEIVKIMQFQDIPVSAEGYINRIRPQAGNKESTNCDATKAADTDWHIAFVENAADDEPGSIVVEVTPRVRQMHPAWTQNNLKPWIHSQLKVRFSGWLLFDPEHKNHLGRFRQTLWEIHPITKIEVQRPDGAWIDLDTMVIP